ncbi:fumarylacetoacetate hydrolase family protein [Inhella sp.]|uniref:fumarylacetoacetate hydrolase family protein n=1 Tax=Inhella sp. TaxID=1921806 RepID=UPI0035B4C970
MSEYVLPPPPQASVSVLGRPERYAVRRIYCVGQNYAEHSREMGSDPQKVPPFFFAKPADAVFEPALQGAMPFPGMTDNLHHEVEWVVALGQPLHKATPTECAAAVWGHTVGLDLTRRDLQAAAKAGGKPWDMSKGFDHSAVLAPLQPLDGPLPTAGAIALSVNGEARQQGDLSDLIWPVPELLARLSQYVALQPGDLVFTGTPAGVGPLQPGDVVLASIDGLPPLRLELARV